LFDLGIAVFSFAVGVVVGAADVPFLSSNVPFPMHDFEGVFHFHA
jgi:hypothetical protein